MFLPGYELPPPTEFDWRTQRDLMNQIGKKPDRAKRTEETAARRDTQERLRQAQEAKKRGASPQELRLILEA